MCAVFNGNSRGEQWMTCGCLRNHIGNTAKASIVLKKLYEKINRQKKSPLFMSSTLLTKANCYDNRTCLVKEVCRLQAQDKAVHCCKQKTPFYSSLETKHIKGIRWTCHLSL